MQSSFFTFFLCLVVFAVAQNDHEFKADVIIYNDPDVYLGVVYAEMYYSFSLNLKRISYSNIVFQEFFDFSEQLRYAYCNPVCNAESIDYSLEEFFNDGNVPLNHDITHDGTTCIGVEATDRLYQLYYNPATGLPCRVIYDTGKTIDFSSFVSLSSDTWYTEVDSWNCPEKECRIEMNLVLVLDSSSSISPENFEREQDFAKSIIASYTLGAEDVNIGIVGFAEGAHIASELSASESSLNNAVNGMALTGSGQTCIGCGIKEGVELYTLYPASLRPDVKRMMIILTDGKNDPSFEEELTEAIAEATVALITRFAIGVDGADPAELATIASEGLTQQTVFYVSDFSQLPDILESLIVSTCENIPSNPCDHEVCTGVCTCNLICVCPDECAPPADGVCSVNECVEGYLTNGCYNDVIDCDDGDLCKLWYCDSSTGCQHDAVECDDNNHCTSNECAAASGCYFIDITDTFCDDNDPCTIQTCDVFSCYNPALDCDDSNDCTLNTCDSTAPEGSQCITEPIECIDYIPNTSDPDECTWNYCYPTGGCYYPAIDNCTAIDLCHTASCNPLVGCVSTPVEDINDNDPCTEDTCNPLTGAISHSPIACDQCINVNCPESTNPLCETIECSETAGGVCVTTQKNCENTGSACKIGSCDSATGECLATPTYCAPQNCKIEYCDLRTGTCEYADIDCDDGNECSTESCNLSTGICEKSWADCASTEPCTVGTCNPATGTCEYEEPDCDDANACTFDTCDVGTDSCVHTTIDCSQGAALCDNFYCNASLGCIITPKTAEDCSDGFGCTRDYCINQADSLGRIGCVSDVVEPEEYCDDEDPCTENLCRNSTGCYHPALVCDPELFSELQECYTAACSVEEEGCYLVLIEGADVDACGVCNGNASCFNNYRQENVLAGALSAGVIAAIVIAAAIVFGLSLWGSKKTYDLIVRSKSVNMGGASENPFYKDSGKEIMNPAYSGSL